MTDLGISIDGRAPLSEIEAQALAAEQGGATTLWIACHLFLRDPVTTAALALAATQKIRIALMAMSPYSIHPVYIAMAAASLEEKYPGRVILCLGAGAPADLNAAGIDSPKPLVAIGEAVKICRQLFAGEMAGFDGQMFKVAGRRLVNGGRRIPITIAASRPNMLKLAGQQSDGVLISAATSPPFVKACLDQVGAGRKSCIVYTKLGSLDAIRRPIGFVLRGAHHAENVRLGGTNLDQQALAAAYAAENWSEVDRLVNDDVVRRHTACGTPQQVRDKLDEYRAIGVDEIVLGGLDDAISIAGALEAATS
jgi:5,10-methylenetetrahydromethanopterin reductase